MRLQEIKDRVRNIEQMKGDNEMAHYYEDELFYDFVKAVKDGKYKTRKKMIKAATELHKVRDIKFTRWYA